MRYWKRVDKQGETTTVESYSHNLDIEGAVEIEGDEFNNYITSLPKPIKPVMRDLAKEIDLLQVKIASLEAKII